MPGVFLDLALLALLAGYALGGYRQGLLVSATSIVGFLGGGALGMAVLPPLLRGTTLKDKPAALALTTLFAVWVTAALGQYALRRLGVAAKRQMKSEGPVHHVDAAGGAVLLLIAAAVLSWFLGAALRPALGPTMGSAISESRVLGVVDRTMPAGTLNLFTAFRSMLADGGFPQVFGGIAPEPITPVAAPDSALARSPVAARVKGSIVKVSGTAAACSRTQEGTGWVLAKDRVVTNAHVVAAEQTVFVQIAGVGRRYKAQVVLFDPRRDIAILAVPGLPAKPLERGPTLGRNASALVIGFPLDGPLRVESARVRAVIHANGRDIFGNGNVTREIYSLYAKVLPGNSGGPLLDEDGRVVGVIFARSTVDDSTGYALTLAEVQPDLALAGRTTPVSTGGCIN